MTFNKASDDVGEDVSGQTHVLNSDNPPNREDELEWAESAEDKESYFVLTN